MSPELRQRIEDAFRSARAAGDAHERERILATLSPEVRGEVEALLTQAEDAVTMAVSGAAISAGAAIGHYRIEAHIGEGGMGTVYRALDTKLNRPVAIKFLSEEIIDSKALSRFQREAQMASSLNHPHIVTVYDVGEYEGRYYLITEFVEGGTLKDWAKRPDRHWIETLDLLIGVADGLAAAHDARIMHRDIKPANILITRDGYAKLADFGLAKLIEGTDKGEVMTRTGVILGTIPYMSPEQASGQQLDARSDVFSFSVVLYELLAGRRPFTASSDLELLKTIVHATPPPMGNAVPPEVSRIVHKALEKDPANRYQSMREMTADLRRATRATSTAPKTGANRLLWGVVGAAAVVIAIGLTIALRNPAPDPNPLANATPIRLTDFPGDEDSPDISPDGKHVIFLSDRDGTPNLWITQPGAAGFRKLTTTGLRAPSRTGQPGGFNWDGSQIWLRGPPPPGNRLSLIPVTGGIPMPFLDEKTGWVDWSPDGKRIVYVNTVAGDPIFVADGDGSNPRQIFIEVPAQHNHFTTWSADGRWVYFAHGNVAAGEMDLWRINADSGAPPEKLTNVRGNIGFPTPLDERTVLYVVEDSTGAGPWLWALDVEQKTSRRISSGLERYFAVAASRPAADGSRRVVASVANPSASLWSTPILDKPVGESDITKYNVPNTRALLPRFGKDGTLFYLSSLGGDDALWRIKNGDAAEIWKSPASALTEAPAVSFDGTQVSVVIKQNGRRRIWVAKADGSQPRLLNETIDVRGTTSWSPDGKWLAAGGTDGAYDGLYLIPVEGGMPRRLVAGGAGNPVWSPDGSLIIYMGDDIGGTTPLKAVRVDSGPVDVDLPQVLLGSIGERMRFLPDGKGLVYMQGGTGLTQNFWILDFATKATRQLTRFNQLGRMRSFDITPDGKQIVFDRLAEHSDIVLFELPPTR